jgi:ABC-type oligopeptide transport system ATPase subunit
MTADTTHTPRDVTPSEGASDHVLEVTDLKVHIPVRMGMRKVTVKAVDGVSFTLERGRTLGVVGESGCGKSTTARAVMRLEEPTNGSVRLLGKDITHLSGEALRSMRRHCQMVFQDPYSALNPRLTVGQIVAEPMQAQGMNRTDITARVEELLDLVGLQPRHRYAFPHQFSGGQRQRIGTARALSTHPEVLILVEPVSALDVSIQAQVLNLLADLRAELGLTYLIISHDLSVVRQVADRVAVMYLGTLVEVGGRDQIWRNPQHPYTKALLSAVPVPDPRKMKERKQQRRQFEHVLAETME